MANKKYVKKFVTPKLGRPRDIFFSSVRMGMDYLRNPTIWNVPSVANLVGRTTNAINIWNANRINNKIDNALQNPQQFGVAGSGPNGTGPATGNNAKVIVDIILKDAEASTKLLNGLSRWTGTVGAAIQAGIGISHFFVSMARYQQEQYESGVNAQSLRSGLGNSAAFQRASTLARNMTRWDLGYQGGSVFNRLKAAVGFGDAENQESELLYNLVQSLKSGREQMIDTRVVSAIASEGRKRGVGFDFLSSIGGTNKISDEFTEKFIEKLSKDPKFRRAAKTRWNKKNYFNGNPDEIQYIPDNDWSFKAINEERKAIKEEFEKEVKLVIREYLNEVKTDADYGESIPQQLLLDKSKQADWWNAQSDEYVRSYEQSARDQALRYRAEIQRKSVGY